MLAFAIVALAFNLPALSRALSPLTGPKLEKFIGEVHDTPTRRVCASALLVCVGLSVFWLSLGGGQWAWATFTLALGGTLVYYGKKACPIERTKRGGACVVVGAFLMSLSANFIAGALAGDTSLDKSIASLSGNVREIAVHVNKLLQGQEKLAEGQEEIKDELAAQRKLLEDYFSRPKPASSSSDSEVIPPEVLAAARELMNSTDARDRAAAAIVNKEWDVWRREIDALKSTSIIESAMEVKTLEGDGLFAQQKFDEAIGPYEAAFQLDPTSFGHRIRLARALQQAQRGDLAAQRRRAAEIYRETLQRTSLSPDRQALIRNNLGTALSDQAETNAAEERARLLAEAVDAYRSALHVRTRESLPEEWAITQNNLGNALRDQAEASAGEERARLLSKAADAYRWALQVHTRETSPLDWAMIQNNLGTVLSDQADAEAGVERARLLTEAVAAYRAALQVQTRDTIPRDWALTQNNLGHALQRQADACAGADRARLLADAVAAYRNALYVRTRETLPLDWAMTQNNLGNVFSDQAEASTGVEHARLLADAVTAFREVLQVYTREALPQDWATTQTNLGNALSHQARASAGVDRARLLADAVTAFREALQVQTRETLPQDWAMTQNNLGNALSDQAETSAGEERARLLTEAVDAYRSALHVRTRETFAERWAGTQNNLGIALRRQAAASAGVDRARLLADAVTAFREALQVQTRETLPQDWAMTQNNLGITLLAILEYRAEDPCPLLRQAIARIKGSLTVYTGTDFPQQHIAATKLLQDLRRLYERHACHGGERGLPFDEIPPAD